MKGRRLRAGIAGFLGGVALVIVALALEVLAHGLPLRGGLLALQVDSVTVWMVESLPFLIGAASFALAGETDPRLAPALLGVGALAGGRDTGESSPPPLPEALQTSTLLGGEKSDARINALEELVKVLRAQARDAAAESESKSSYLANMSHELRSPLNAIVGHTELMAEEAVDNPRMSSHLETVASAGRRLVHMIDNILDLSKIEVGQLAVVLEDVDMAQVLDEIRVAISPVAVQSGNAFSMRLAPGVRMARGDHMRIRQVMMNLIGNALKFTHAGTVAVTVERNGQRRDAGVAIRVKDTGVGLTDEELELVFDDYRQAEARVTKELGTGLGLAISRKLAQLMGGRVEATSRKNIGSEFSLILPHSVMDSAAVPQRSTLALNERLAGMRLLLVDADPSGTTLARYLERVGLRVELVKDSVSARIAARASRAHVVVLDAGLHGSWGLAEELVNDGVEVVVTSLRDEDVEPALQLGVTAFLVRPLHRKLTLATLERCLES